MLGLDGASWAWLNSPLVDETMPNLRALLADSSVGNLASTVPSYTGPGWTTITTGIDPGRHGIFGFTNRMGRPNSNADVPVARVWDYVGGAGGRSLVVNVPLTFPPKSMEGVLVGGMPVPPNVPYTFPAGLGADLDAMAGGAYVPDISLTGTPSVGPTSTALAEMTDARRKAVRELTRREDWDFIAVVYVTPDRIGHPWWKYLVPGSPLYETHAGEEARAEVRRTLTSLDDAIEDLVAAQPSGTAIVLCSDHGFGPLDADVFFDATLIDAGLLSAGGLGRSLGRRLSRLPHTNAGRLIPRSLVHKVKKRVNEGAKGAAWTAPTYEQSVYLKDPSDREVRDRVTELLMGLTTPDGERIVSQVHSREELFAGDLVDRAPDLWPLMVSETIQLHDGVHASTAWRSRDSLPWGTHAREGVVAISGAGAPASLNGDARDISPTLLALLGLRVPGLDGASLVDRRVEEISEVEVGSVDEGLSHSDEEAIFEHLRGLGYVE